MKVVFFICLSLLSTVVSAQTIYLVRHAEKEVDGTKDPVLTTQGIQRAQNIADMLSSANIKHIYSTDYQRTQMTAKPLADMLGVDVKSYDPRQLKQFAEQLKQQEGNILVVGHSNTTPELTHFISGKSTISLTEAEYDFIFQVIIDGPHSYLNVLKSLPRQKD